MNYFKTIEPSVDTPTYTYQQPAHPQFTPAITYNEPIESLYPNLRIPLPTMPQHRVIFFVSHHLIFSYILYLQNL
jgi:hypothetical protein